MQATQKFIQVEIVDIHRSLFSGECFSVVAPSVEGEVCILARHAPLLIKLIPGEIRIKSVQEELFSFYVSGGFLETIDSKVTVLADHMLRSDEIDREAALQSKLDAEIMLKDRRLSREHKDEAQLLLLKAVAQLKVLEHVNSNRLHNPNL